MTDIQARKASHLDLCASDEVAFSTKTTLFEEVELLHDSLPELDIHAIDLSTQLLGRGLRAPLLIAGMTGGIERAAVLNRELAATAQHLGIGFGFGSMRPLLEHGITDGYLVRDVAPDALLLGNLGVVQVAGASDDALRDLVGMTGVDALAVHLNPAQEVVQAGGDTDFRGGVEALQRAVELLDIPIVAKETGCGISARSAQRIAQTGVSAIDVGGAGGTSWVGVETLRARAATERLGRLYWDWGIPTAASILQTTGAGPRVIATGGVHSGLDIARAIALGATVAGMARPFLMAWNDGGADGAREFGLQLIHELRVAMLLTGSADLGQLAKTPRMLGPTLERWAKVGT